MKVTDFFGKPMLHFITFFIYFNIFNYFLHSPQVLNITKVKIMNLELHRLLCLLLNGDNICAMVTWKSVFCLISYAFSFRKLARRSFFL